MTYADRLPHSSSNIKTLLIVTAGTNCDQELARAFALAGSHVDAIHINRLIADPGLLAGYQIMGIPGGFSYGDDISSGKIFADILTHHLWPQLRQWTADGKLLIGVCNGFQVLVKAGLLPAFSASDENPSRPAATLTHNRNGRFEDRWVHLQTDSSLCKWIRPGQRLMLPVAHGEGRFVVAHPEILKQLQTNDQIVCRYVDSSGHATQAFPENPNGSLDAIAGICDPTGRILGLMPHPERYVETWQHPFWTRLDTAPTPDGRQFFENAVAWIHQSSATTFIGA